jgi:hypothetical protein
MGGIIIVHPIDPEIGPSWTAVGAPSLRQCIDDYPHNGDTDYVTHDNSGNALVCALEAVAGIDPNDSVLWVAIETTVKQAPDGDITDMTSFLLLASSTEVPGQTRVVLAGSEYVTVRDHFATNPDTGLPWRPPELSGWAVGHTHRYTGATRPRLTSLTVLVKVNPFRPKATGVNAGLESSAAPQAKIVASAGPGPGSLIVTGASLGVQTSAARLGPSGEGG